MHTKNKATGPDREKPPTSPRRRASRTHGPRDNYTKWGKKNIVRRAAASGRPGKGTQRLEAQRLSARSVSPCRALRSVLEVPIAKRGGTETPWPQTGRLTQRETPSDAWTAHCPLARVSVPQPAHATSPAPLPPGPPQRRIRKVRLAPPRLPRQPVGPRSGSCCGLVLLRCLRTSKQDGADLSPARNVTRGALAVHTVDCDQAHANSKKRPTRPTPEL